ncbi:MAG: hypothetical protein KDB24_16515, partial [Microthrixaceae bacterium]|nr:hypothetical protein [Microthrixaceae bacterium]
MTRGAHRRAEHHAEAGPGSEPEGRCGRPLAGAVAGEAVAALVAGGLLATLPDHMPGGAKRWERTNHRGETVTLLEGPAAVGATVAGLLAGRVVGGSRNPSPAPAMVAAIGSGLAGGVDDLVGAADTKGLRGHLLALTRGEVTTGAVKIGAIGASGLAAALLAGRNAQGSSRPSRIQAAVDGALIAGSANLMNLFDLRPGRALKVSALTAGAMSLTTRRYDTEPAVVVGASLGLMRDD